MLLNWSGIWKLEKADAFWVQVPDANGNCPAKTLPMFRFFNNRRDANHRHTVDLSVRRGMLNRAWAPEGSAPTASRSVRRFRSDGRFSGSDPWSCRIGTDRV